jgi:hypothetical protein
MYIMPKALAGIAVAALLAGCDSNDNELSAPPPPAPLGTAKVRFVHASPDAPNVDVAGLAGTLVDDLAFKEASAFETFSAGALTVRVDAAVPGGAATVIGPVNLPLAADTAYSVIAVGEAAEIEPLVIAEPLAAVPAGSVRAQVVHAAPSAPAVAVYVTAPDALLEQSAPLGTFAFGEELGPVTVPGGDYRIRVTASNDPAAVVFDSGTVALPAGADLLVAAVENTGPGTAPISLVVADGNGSFEILDAATPAQLRVIHASPDAPAVDVIVDDDFANPVLEDVPFAAFSGYLSVPAGVYNVKVTPANNAGVIVIDADVEVDAGRQYSVYATGPLAAIAPYVLTDDGRSVGTEAKVRIVHTAPGAGNVDIYVTAPGADIATASPAFSNVPFRAETGYVGLAAGSYDVTVTPTGTKTAAIGPAPITVIDGGVYTAAARDATGGGAPFGLILLDGFAP